MSEQVDGRVQKTEKILALQEINWAAYERAGFNMVCVARDPYFWERISGTAYHEDTQRYGNTNYYWESGIVWRKGEVLV